MVDELRRRGIPGGPTGVGVDMAGPTILARGDDEQRSRYLADIACGRTAWCQLFSEPGAGSDLASLQTRAVRDGDQWRVSGQKVWSTLAHHADFGMLLARTDPAVPKHRGITWFVLDMHQPGVEVRPLRQMNGKAEFNEVFLDDVVVWDRDVVGEVNAGWATTLTTLGLERAASTRIAGVGEPGAKAGWRERRAGDFAHPTSSPASRRPGVHEDHASFPSRPSGGSSTIHSSVRTWRGRTGQPDHAVPTRCGRRPRRPRARCPAPRRARSSPTRTPRSPPTRDCGCRDRTPRSSTRATPPPTTSPSCSSSRRRSPSRAGRTRSSATSSAEKTLGLPREPDPEREQPFDATHAGRERSGA